MIKNQCQKIQDHILKRFNLIEKLGSGAYGHVYKVQDKHTLKVYALKKIFDAFQHSTDAQRTYREIQVLKQTNHPNIIKLYETFPSQNNQDVYILFEYMQSDLHYAISDNIMKDGHFKYITYQIAKALKYLHNAQIIHRDLKPSNILVNSDCKIKLCDFGLVRSINNKHGSKGSPLLTEKVATRWYRAPQILFGSRKYSTPIDIWSFACIIYEMIERKPIFPGSSTKDQLIKILQYTGIPSQQDMKSIKTQTCQKFITQVAPNIKYQKDNYFKHMSPQFKILLKKMLVFNPEKRLQIDEILSDPMFKMFRKIQEQIVVEGKIQTTMDDNKKLTVDQYRKLIYNPIMHQKSNQVSQTRKSEKEIKALTKIKSCHNVSSFMKQHQNVGIKKPRVQTPSYQMKKSMDYLSSTINSPMAKTSFIKSTDKITKKYFNDKEIDQVAIMDKTVADISELSNPNEICMTKAKTKHLSPKPSHLKSLSKQFVWFSPKRNITMNSTIQMLSPKKFHPKNSSNQSSLKHFLFGNDHKNQF